MPKLAGVCVVVIQWGITSLKNWLIVELRTECWRKRNTDSQVLAKPECWQLNWMLTILVTVDRNKNWSSIFDTKIIKLQRVQIETHYSFDLGCSSGLKVWSNSHFHNNTYTSLEINLNLHIIVELDVKPFPSIFVPKTTTLTFTGKAQVVLTVSNTWLQILFLHTDVEIISEPQLWPEETSM